MGMGNVRQSQDQERSYVRFIQLDLCAAFMSCEGRPWWVGDTPYPHWSALHKDLESLLACCGGMA